MEWYEIAILIITFFIFLFVLLLIFRTLKYNSIKKMIKNIIYDKYPNVEIHTFKQEDVFQFEFFKEQRYLIKLIDMNPKNEVIITNSEKVVINDDIKGWKRSSKPHFVPSIKDFIKISDAIKIVLIYPNCHNITKYINECDVFTVEKHEKIDDLYYIRFTQFSDFLIKH